MNRPYTAQSPYSLTPTERIRSPRGSGRYSGRHGSFDDDPDGFSETDTDVYPPYRGEDYNDAEDDAENYDDYIDEARLDRRWMWIAGVAGAILFVAVITASMILGGGDSGSVSATVASPLPTPSSAPAPTQDLAAPPAPTLPAETVTTVSPTAETPVPTAAPAPTAVLPAPQAVPPPAAAVPGIVRGLESPYDAGVALTADLLGRAGKAAATAIPRLEQLSTRGRSEEIRRAAKAALARIRR